LADRAPLMGTLTIEPGQLDDAARAAYAKAFDARRDTTGGLGDMVACLSRAQLFDVKLGDQVVARYALQQVDRAKGVEVFVVGAAGSVPGVDLVEVVEPFIAQQCATADRLAINTRRKGLVKKLLRQGWTLDSYVMRKKLR
jgi:hypothetical protein